MKNILTFLVLNFCVLTLAFGQEHLSFNSILLDGDLKSFVSKLETKGFTINEFEGNTAILSGTFIDTDSEAYVFGSSNSNTVWKVVVSFPERLSWKELNDEYKTTKEIYQSKYGDGKSKESFTESLAGGDNSEIVALKEGNCTYTTDFESEIGLITVKLTPSGCVRIIYEDAMSKSTADREKQANINSEI